MGALACMLGLLVCVATATYAQEEALAPLSRAPWRNTLTAGAKATPRDTLTLTLPFFDDFAGVEGSPSPLRWLTDDAYVNNDYVNYPPTLGVATLDALRANGELHAGASTNLFGADTMASQLLRLDSVFTPTRRALGPADSVYLSFYYLPGGGTGDLWQRVGDTPDEQDSLILEFYNAETDTWQVAWSRGGISEDTLVALTGRSWQYVAVPVTTPGCFSRRFQFRFRNYCSLDGNTKTGMNGNVDQWNLDYIYLTYGRSAAEITYRDVAFVCKPTSALKDYQAMPARQFRPSDMASHLTNVISNLYGQALATQYSYDVVSATGSLLSHYDGGYENAPSYPTTGTYQQATAHASPTVTFTYPTDGEAGSYNIIHMVREGTAGDQHPANDTAVYVQTLGDYYAYDDGIPENGYGLISTSNKVFLACLFVLNRPDTLTAVDLYFNHTINNENEHIAFYLSVWSNDHGVPGTLIARDEERQRVTYSDMNHYVRYRLAHPIVISDSVFIGFEQSGNTYINLGFDRSHDVHERIYYKTSGDWQQSILHGALMLRPCVGVAALTGISDNPDSPCHSLRLYPNPAHDKIHLQTTADANHCQLQVFDMRGLLIYSGRFTDTLNTSLWKPGLYLVRLIDSHTGDVSTHRFVVNH